MMESDIMIMETLKRSYFVVQKLTTNDYIESFLCKDLLENTKTRYTVIHIKDKELVYQLLPVFMELREEGEANDFIECFNWENKLYVVFYHNEGRPLKEQLQKESYSLLEKIKIGRSALEKQLALHMPAYFIYDGIRLEHITILEGLNVSFGYELLEIEKYSEITFQQVCQQWYTVFLALFEKEWAGELSIELNSFLQKLEQGSFSNMLQIYEAYQVVLDSLSKKLNTKIKPKSIWLKGWNKSKVLFPYTKPFFAAVILVVCFLFLLWAIREHQANAKKEAVFERIGVVEMQP